jgi:hypothetical protein
VSASAAFDDNIVDVKTLLGTLFFPARSKISLSASA